MINDFKLNFFSIHKKIYIIYVYALHFSYVIEDIYISIYEEAYIIIS